MTFRYACITNYLNTELTNYIEQCPSSETNTFSAIQEMSHIFWNLERHYGIHNSLPPARILSHINPVHAPLSHLLKNHFNITLPSMSSLPSGLFPSAPNISLLFGHLSNIWWAVKLALETKLYFMFIKAVMVKKQPYLLYWSVLHSLIQMFCQGWPVHQGWWRWALNNIQHSMYKKYLDIFLSCLYLVWDKKNFLASLHFLHE